MQFWCDGLTLLNLRQEMFGRKQFFCADVGDHALSSGAETNMLIDEISAKNKGNVWSNGLSGQSLIFYHIANFIFFNLEKLAFTISNLQFRSSKLHFFKLYNFAFKVKVFSCYCVRRFLKIRNFSSAATCILQFCKL